MPAWGEIEILATKEEARECVYVWNSLRVCVRLESVSMCRTVSVCVCVCDHSD
jgi:hypothetical protein